MEVVRPSPRVLLVNPWITDFAAHDLWARPLGLLYLAGVARDLGCEPVLIDCTDRFHQSLPERPYRPRRYSCGKYPAEEIVKPSALEFVPRRYKRYGISPDAFRASLDFVGRPDLILVGSRMTYWYPGVREAIELLRERFRGVPIVLGGVYPTLFPKHAKRLSGADVLVEGEGENEVARLLGGKIEIPTEIRRYDLCRLETLPPPAYDLLTARDCLPFLTSRGCPRRCSYCASGRLFPGFRRRDPLRAADELIAAVERHGFSDVAFYDDALLADAPDHFVPFCRRLLRAGVRARFHTPNGLDYTAIEEEIAQVMAQLDFKSIRLSLETAVPVMLKRIGRDPDLLRFEVSLRALERAGFDPADVGVYVLMGLPGQSRADVEFTVDYVLSLGATPRLAEYSPLPATEDWKRVCLLGNPPLADEPLLTNNSVFFRMLGEFPDDWLNELRCRIREARPKDGTGSP